MKAVDMTGRTVGRLTVLGRAPRRPGVGQALWRCRCECGNETVVYGSNLRQQTTASCGCVLGDLTRARLTTHGMSRGTGRPGHPLYMIWEGIKKRCLSPSNMAYPRYGGRGIEVHAAWVNDFPAFAEYITAHLGERPSAGHSLDRIDNDGPYAPGNLRWATPYEQAENRGRMNAAMRRIRELESRQSDLLAEVDRLTAERDSWKNATDATGLALGEVNRQRGEAQDRANAAEAEIARLTAALAACTCPDSYETYAGPEADCPVHGAVRALNEATAEIDALRQRADQVARAENLRDKWLSWPPGSEHYAAGLMLACYLDGTAYGSDEPRPEPGTLHPGVPGTTQITQSTQATTDADDGERP